MRKADVICYVTGPQDLAQSAYKTGFDDGFDAAVATLRVISEGLEERDGVGLDPALMDALTMCRGKAFEY